MSNPKKHHYVQRAHLDRWSDSGGNIFICDLTNGNVYEGPAKSAAWKKYYYSIHDPEHPEFNFEIEKFLGSDIEGPAVPVVTKFCDKYNLSAQEKGCLALYIAFQKLRVPFAEKLTNQIAEKLTKENLLKTLQDKGKFEKFTKENTKRCGSGIEIPSREEMIKTVEEDRLKIKYPRAHSLKTMLELSLPISELYAKSRWALLEARESSFIISDNPAVTISLKKKDGSIDVSETIFPLSPKYCLLINQQTQGKIIVSDESVDGVKEINRRILLYATRFLFGNNKKLLNECYQEFKRLKPLTDKIQTNYSGKAQFSTSSEKLFIKRVFKE